jgi:hypothetical protein
LDFARFTQIYGQLDVIATINANHTGVRSKLDERGEMGCVRGEMIGGDFLLLNAMDELPLYTGQTTLFVTICSYLYSTYFNIKGPSYYPTKLPWE